MIRVTASPALALADTKATERWYEITNQGKKVGYTKVVWAPSTWRGKKTIHDRTTVVKRQVRNMAGYRTAVEVPIPHELDAGSHGPLRQPHVGQAGEGVGLIRPAEAR